MFKCATSAGSWANGEQPRLEHLTHGLTCEQHVCFLDLHFETLVISAWGYSEWQAFRGSATADVYFILLPTLYT